MEYVFLSTRKPLVGVHLAADEINLQSWNLSVKISRRFYLLSFHESLEINASYCEDCIHLHHVHHHHFTVSMITVHYWLISSTF